MKTQVHYSKNVKREFYIIVNGLNNVKKCQDFCLFFNKKQDMWDVCDMTIDFSSEDISIRCGCWCEEKRLRSYKKLIQELRTAFEDFIKFTRK